MASTGRRIAYRQGFRSSWPVTEVLNAFVKTPRRSFILFSEAEYTHTPLEAIRYDDQANKSVTATIREINDKVTRLDTYSKNLAAKTIHLSLPAHGTEYEHGLVLHFTRLFKRPRRIGRLFKNFMMTKKSFVRLEKLRC